MKKTILCILGCLCLLFAFYLGEVTKRTRQEMNSIRLGVSDIQSIEEASGLGLLVNRETFLYNLAVSLYNENEYERVKKIILPLTASKNLEMRKDAYKLLGEIQVTRNPYEAARGYIKALEIDPTDLHCKLMLEKLYMEIAWTKIPLKEFGEIPDQLIPDDELQPGSGTRPGNPGDDI